MKRAAIEIIGKQNCTGCWACFNVCPVKVIRMELDDEGFMYPVVNSIKCTGCGLCQEKCPVIKESKNESLVEPLIYAAWSNDNETRLVSSSGGIFSEIARKVLNERGVIFGVRFNKDFIVEHAFCKDEQSLSELRGSKYIQSHVGDAYLKSIKSAKQGNLVLFVGTPCQIAALNKFVEGEDFSSKVITCDLICHGVPSEIIFKEYLKSLSNKYKGNLVNYSFRDKSHGWDKFSIHAEFDNGKMYIKEHKFDPFYIGFLKNLYLRPSCYHCRFSRVPRVADITLGDFWGIQKELKDQRGVSLVSCNTKKGEDFLNLITSITKVLVSITDMNLSNKRFVNGELKMNNQRNAFYNLLTERGFKVAARQYLRGPSAFQKVLRRAKYLVKRLVYFGN